MWRSCGDDILVLLLYFGVSHKGHVASHKYTQYVISDIDECADGTHTCDSNAVCADTDGTFTCTCDSGYTGDGQSCMGE